MEPIKRRSPAKPCNTCKSPRRLSPTRKSGPTRLDFIPTAPADRRNIVEKRASAIDYSIELEYAVGAALNTLNSEHFCKSYELVKHGGTLKDLASPGLLVEKIVGYPLEDITDVAKFNAIAMTLAAVAIMNERTGISHNDLHAENVRVRRTNEDVYAYVFPDGEEFAIKTFGLSPVLFGFEMAFTGMGSDKMLTPISQTGIGIFPHEMDPMADVRSLLYTVNPPFSLNVENVVGTTDIDTDVRGKLTGHFKHGVFPDFKAEIRRHLKGWALERKLELFAAHCPLPLRRINTAWTLEELTDEVAELDKLDIATLKLILDKDFDWLEEGGYVTTPLTRKYLTTACTKVIHAINNILCEVAEKATRLKRPYQSMGLVKNSRDALRVIVDRFLDKLIFAPGMSVKVYDVISRTTATLVLTESEAEDLNNHKTTLKRLMVQSLK